MLLQKALELEIPLVPGDADTRKGSGAGWVGLTLWEGAGPGWGSAGLKGIPVFPRDLFTKCGPGGDYPSWE